MALRVIVGPPAAGKTTWVNTHANPGDIVVDYDRIAAALTAPTADPPGRAVRSAAFAARKAAVATALTHIHDTDVYVIHSAPSPQALAMYAKHDAEIVTIDPGPDVVFERCEWTRSRAALNAARHWYATRESIALPQFSRAW